MVTQPLLAKGIDVSIIEIDVEMIRAAGQFGFKVYYGDGTRLDVLRASGAATAEAILVCVEKQEVADRIVELAKADSRIAKLFVRAFDRGHALRLINAGVDYQLREVLSPPSCSVTRCWSISASRRRGRRDHLDVRRRDEQRLEMQMAGGLGAGLSLMRGNMATTQPAPLIVPAKGQGTQQGSRRGDRRCRD